MYPLPYSFSVGFARGNPVTPLSAPTAAAGEVLYPLPCSSWEVPGLLSLLSEDISSAPPAAARPRQALFGHLSGEWSLNEALQTHPWDSSLGNCGIGRTGLGIGSSGDNLCKREPFLDS